MYIQTCIVDHKVYNKVNLLYFLYMADGVPAGYLVTNPCNIKLIYDAYIKNDIITEKIF